MSARRQAICVLLVLVCAGCTGDDGPSTTEIELLVQGGRAEQAAEVLENRLDGVDGASVRGEGSGRVAVEVPKDRARALLPVLVTPGRFELYDLQRHLIRPSVSPQGFPVAIADRHRMPAGAVILRCGVEQRYCPGVAMEPTGTYYYALRGQPELTGADFERDEARQDFDPTGEPIVFLQFTAAGAGKFEQLTREIARRSQLVASRGVPHELALQQVAMVLDGVVLSAPVVDFNENPDGIPAENGAQISGLSSLDDARNLVAMLQGGELPSRLVVARGSSAEMED